MQLGHGLGTCRRQVRPATATNRTTNAGNRIIQGRGEAESGATGLVHPTMVPGGRPCAGEAGLGQFQRKRDGELPLCAQQHRALLPLKVQGGSTHAALTQPRTWNFIHPFVRRGAAHPARQAAPDAPGRLWRPHSPNCPGGYRIPRSGWSCCKQPHSPPWPAIRTGGPAGAVRGAVQPRPY